MKIRQKTGIVLLLIAISCIGILFLLFNSFGKLKTERLKLTTSLIPSLESVIEMASIYHHWHESLDDYLHTGDVKYKADSQMFSKAFKLELNKYKESRFSEEKSRIVEEIKIAEKADKKIFEEIIFIFDRNQAKKRQININVPDSIKSRFRKSIHRIENDLEDVKKETAGERSTHQHVAIHNSIIEILQIRRNEKNFLLRGSNEYVAKVGHLIKTFKNHIKKISLSPELENRIFENIENYHKKFLELVAVTEKIREDEYLILKKREELSAREELHIALVKGKNLEWTRLNEGRQQASSIIERTREYIIIGFVIVILLIGILILIGNHIIRSILKLHAAIEETGEGDLPQITDIRTSDELGDLSVAFNRMVKDLKTYRDQLEKSRNNLAEKVRIATNDLAHEKNRIEAIMNSAADPIMTVDVSRNITMVNQTFLYLLGWEEKDVLRKFCGDIISCRDSEGNLLCDGECDISKVFQEDKYIRGRAVVTTSTGLGINMHTSNAPLKDSQGRIIGLVRIMRDITKETEIDRMKTEFISTVSHELRTPLTSIKGSLGLILGGAAGEINEDLAELLTIAQNNSDRLIRLINDILDISKIESGKIQMKLASISILDCIKDSAAEIDSFARDHRVKVEFNIPDAAAPVFADKDRIVQVVTNLLSNAIKFSEAEGTVLVEVKEDQKDVYVSVADSGIGIPEDHLGRVFDKFQQVDSSAIRKKGGTGLGLPICRAIIDEHKGKIWVESTPGKGSTFTFTLSREKRKKRREPSEKLLEVTRGISKTVLICDDEADITHLIRIYLEKEGFRCVETYSGQEAIEMAKRDKPDVIALDILMPEMDGFETARILKSAPETRDIPIVFVTVQKDEKGMGLSFTFSDWITKPIDEKRLIQSIKKAAGEKTGNEATILIVDDDVDLVRVLKKTVETEGLKTETAYGGKEAIEKIKISRPDLIILDVMMPDIDGFEVVNSLKESRWTRDIPIIILTARDLSLEDKEALRTGVTKFLMKSYTSEKELLGNITGLLKDKIQTF